MSIFRFIFDNLVFIVFTLSNVYTRHYSDYTLKDTFWNFRFISHKGTSLERQSLYHGLHLQNQDLVLYSMALNQESIVTVKKAKFQDTHSTTTHQVSFIIVELTTSRCVHICNLMLNCY